MEKRLMADELEAGGKSGSIFTVDVWAVLIAFVLALLVKAGLLQHVPW
jgi:hypothetical protein